MENPVVSEKEIIIKCSLEEMVKSFFKDYVIVWHDPKVNCLENKEYIAQLTKFCEVFSFTDWQKAKDYVSQAKVSCHVITSGKNGESLVKEIYLAESVENIYVFCGEREYHSSWAQNYKKVSCVETQIETILSQIQQNLLKWYQKGSSLKSDLPAFAPLFDDSDKSKMNHRHLRLKIIPNFKNREQAKNDFLALSKGVYFDPSHMKFLEDFEKSYHEYNKEQILRWYTKESFLHKVTNNCLRISTSDSIQYSRLLIRDMEKAIKEQYQIKSKNFSGLLYRGASLSEREWSNLKENTGREIEMCGFLSVSKDKSIAESFLYQYSSQKVFITIIVPKGPNEEEQGFAEIEAYSQFSNEKEVLFNIRSRFTILETEDRYSQEFPYRHIVLLYGAQGFRKFVAEQNSFLEVSISSVENILCVQCKIQAREMPEKNFFMSLKDHQGQYYCCEKCICEKTSFETASFLCLPLLNRAQGIETKKIKGCLLMRPNESDIPFYGYKCGKCQAKQQKQYFTCADCDEREKRWCQNCFGLKLSCMQDGHSVILETNPFSFWCEKMSPNESSHLKFHNDFFQKDDDIFQQAEIYVQSHEYTKAIEYYNFYIQENEAKGEDTNLATTYNNIGKVFLHRGEYTRAFRFCSKSLNIRKSVYGDNHPDVALSYNNIGNVHYYQGEYKKALQYYLKSLDIRKSVYGDIHPDVAHSYNNIGNVHYYQGEYKKALEYYLKSLDIRKSVYGDNHPNVADSFYNIGNVHFRQGEYKEALEYYLKSLDIRKSVYGDNHPNVAFSYNSIGNVHYCQGEYKEALEYYFKSLDIQKSVSGDNHPNVALSYNNIGIVHYCQGEYKEALEYYLKSLDIRKSVYGDNHPDVADSFYNIGNVHFRQGEYKEALEYYLKSLDIRKSVYGDNHPNIAVSYNSLALVYSNQKEYNKALEYSLKSLEIYKSIFGDNHPKTIEASDQIHQINSVIQNKSKKWYFF